MRSSIRQKSPCKQRQRATLRPGFVGNFLFLALSVAMLALIARSGLVSEPPFFYIEPPREEAPSRFTDDDLWFYQDTITQFLLNHRFNGSVLIAREGHVLMSRSFGFADFRNHSPVLQETPFQLASISKTFTAAAVLMLEKRGKLHIDDNVVQHIPEFPYPDITIRHLLNHTSGLQNYMWLVERFWKHPHPPDNEDMMELFIRHQRPLDFRSGSRFAYSNTGYAFLGLLIERVSGQRYPDFMRDHIFEPLNMTGSFAYDLHSTAPAVENRAYGFRTWGRGHIIIPDVDHDGILGDKGIYSTTLDLYKWDRAIAQGLILDHNTWNAAFARTRLNNDRTVSYGMGWRLQSFMGKHVPYHPGRWNGFRTALKRFVDDDATLILLSNTNRDITPLINGLQGILFHEEIAALSTPPDEEISEDYSTMGGGQ